MTHTFIYYRYKRNGGKYWKNFINTKGEEWARMNLDWFHSFSPENRLVTFYDELLSKPLAVLKTILEFLQVIDFIHLIGNQCTLNSLVMLGLMKFIHVEKNVFFINILYQGTQLDYFGYV